MYMHLKDFWQDCCFICRRLWQYMFDPRVIRFGGHCIFPEDREAFEKEVEAWLRAEDEEKEKSQKMRRLARKKRRNGRRTIPTPISMETKK